MRLVQAQVLSSYPAPPSLPQWGDWAPLGPHARVRARDGWMAVVQPFHGRFLVTVTREEIRHQRRVASVGGEYGFVPLLIPAMLMAVKALHEEAPQIEVHKIHPANLGKHVQVQAKKEFHLTTQPAGKGQWVVGVAKKPLASINDAVKVAWAALPPSRRQAAGLPPHSHPGHVMRAPVVGATDTSMVPMRPDWMQKFVQIQGGEIGCEGCGGRCGRPMITGMWQ